METGCCSKYERASKLEEYHPATESATITWKRFREQVEAALDAKSISQDTPIWYIDISLPLVDEDFSISFEEGLGLSIGKGN